MHQTPIVCIMRLYDEKFGWRFKFLTYNLLPRSFPSCVVFRLKARGPEVPSKPSRVTPLLITTPGICTKMESVVPFSPR